MVDRPGAAHWEPDHPTPASLRPSAVLRSREQDSDHKILVADLEVVADGLATG